MNQTLASEVFQILKGQSHPAYQGSDLRDVLDFNRLGSLTDKQRQLEILAMNQIHFSQADQIEEKLISSGIQPVRLKSIAFMKDLYPHLGIRQMEDFDILIKEGELDMCIGVLKENGFTHNGQEQWDAGAHRLTYCKTLDNGFEFSVDIHTKIFWEQSKKIDVQPIKDKQQNILRLCSETELLHLIANWSFQDNFVSLDKLMDIRFYLEKYEAIIDWQKFDHQVKNAKLVICLQLIQYIFEKHLDHKGFAKSQVAQKPLSLFVQKMISKEFLLDPQKQMIKYLSISLLVKNENKLAIKYLWGWFRHFGHARLLKILKRKSALSGGQ